MGWEGEFWSPWGLASALRKYRADSANTEAVYNVVEGTFLSGWSRSAKLTTPRHGKDIVDGGSTSLDD